MVITEWLQLAHRDHHTSWKKNTVFIFSCSQVFSCPQQQSEDKGGFVSSAHLCCMFVHICVSHKLQTHSRRLLLHFPTALVFVSTIMNITVKHYLWNSKLGILKKNPAKAFTQMLSRCESRMLLVPLVFRESIFQLDLLGTDGSPDLSFGDFWNWILEPSCEGL